MADKYARWNRWAPQFIADLVHDFGLAPEQAAGFVGNFAAESAYFNDIIEDGAIAKGWAGGTGFAQWTGLRRKSFEAWLKRKGWSAESYEGNYSYLYRELTTTEKAAIQHVKGATSPENAAWRVARYFERPRVINTGPRAQAALEALALYRANPVPPTVWAADAHKEPPVPVTIPPAVVVPPEDHAALPWWRSGTLTGSGAGLVAAGLGALALWQPGVPIAAQSKEFWTAVVGVVGTAWSVYSRLKSSAQPVTATQAGADKITAERTLAADVAATDAATVATLPPAAVSPFAQAPPALPVPLESLPLNHIVAELPHVMDLLRGLAAEFAKLKPPTPVAPDVKVP